jgi:protein associated with RNAse G/E
MGGRRMYIAIAILVSVFVVISFIRTVSNRNWKLIYSSFGNDDYFTIIAKLQSAGIKYKVVIPFTGVDNRNIRYIDQTQYDIYVRKEEEHLAIGALHKMNG